MGQKTAIIYARVSTGRQAEEGVSVESQISSAHKKADQLEASVVKVFTDEGISGRTSRRPAFQDAIAYCAAFGIDYLIVWSSSRFARNKIDAASYKKGLEKSGTRLIYCTADIDPKTDEGWLLDSMFEMMDEHYSRIVSKDTRGHMMKNASNGHWNGGAVPLGYTPIADGNRKRLAVDEVEAEIVRKIFRLYIGGSGTKTIALQMNAQGLLRRGVRWTSASIGLLLKNHVYIGFIVFNRRNHVERLTRPREDWIMTRSHEPLVLEEDFIRVQETMARRTPSGGHGHPASELMFTGLMECGRCGKSLKSERATGRSQIYHYYNCQGATKGTGCIPYRIPAPAFDAWLKAQILELVFTPGNIADIAEEMWQTRGQWVKDRALRRKVLVTEVRDIESRRDRLFEIMELHGQNAPNLGDLTSRLRAHKDRLADLGEVLQRLEEESPPAADLGQDTMTEAAATLRAVIEANEDPKKLRTFFQTFIERIIVNRGEILLRYRPDRLVSSRRSDSVHSTVKWLPGHSKVRTIEVRMAIPDTVKRAA